MGKVRLNTTKHLHRARQRARKEAAEVRREAHVRPFDERSPMLRGVDLDRYEALGSPCVSDGLTNPDCYGEGTVCYYHDPVAR